jgi:hypothetical protein
MLSGRFLDVGRIDATFPFNYQLIYRLISDEIFQISVGEKPGQKYER